MKNNKSKLPKNIEVGLDNYGRVMLKNESILDNINGSLNLETQFILSDYG